MWRCRQPMIPENKAIYKCCKNGSPVWLVSYPNGSIFGICENERNNITFSTNAIKAVHIESETIVPISEVFGGQN